MGQSKGGGSVGFWKGGGANGRSPGGLRYPPHPPISLVSGVASSVSFVVWAYELPLRSVLGVERRRSSMISAEMVRYPRREISCVKLPIDRSPRSKGCLGQGFAACVFFVVFFSLGFCEFFWGIGNGVFRARFSFFFWAFVYCGCGGSCVVMGAFIKGLSGQRVLKENPC